ncbi:MAG TPA: polysaccharide biosynthesis/export family protein [Terriglobales bacterium]|nr:polysaccharide biosynthesis/export family protein [Terriglobales bacterium]
MRTSALVAFLILLIIIPVAGQNVTATSAAVAGETPSPRTGGALGSESFVIGTGDVLAINVWKESEISRVVPVRSDGRISLPLVGELQASGQTPKQLETQITAKLKDYVSEPEVTVMVQEIKSQKFNVLGMVMKPGSYVLTKPMTVIDGIATAGGFRDFAKQKNIYVLRHMTDGREVRLPFNYKEVVKGQKSDQNVQLESNDTIVIP